MSARSMSSTERKAGARRPTYPIPSRRSWALIATLAAIVVGAVIASQHEARQASGCAVAVDPAAVGRAVDGGLA